MLTDLMEELAGDDGRAGGAQLRQLPLPDGMAGKTYGELFANLTLTRKLLPLGLYRRKSENSAWRLYYVGLMPPIYFLVTFSLVTFSVTIKSHQSSYIPTLYVKARHKPSYVHSTLIILC